MNHADDRSATGNHDSLVAGQGIGLDPGEAARILDQTRRRAARQFDIDLPLITMVRGFAVLGAYGTVWLSVRGQNPYQGPSPVALIVMYALLLGVIGASAASLKRATAGVSGRSRRERRATFAAVGIVWIAVYVFMGALDHDGVSPAIVYGVYPASAPLIIVGAVAAGFAAARTEWRSLVVALTVVSVGAAGAFAGPAGVWAVDGVGLLFAVLVHAAATSWQHDG